VKLPPDPHRRRIDLPLALAAAFAMLWAVARASVQSVILPKDAPDDVLHANIDRRFIDPES
jgi:hypothetical protein